MLIDTVRNYSFDSLNKGEATDVNKRIREWFEPFRNGKLVQTFWDNWKTYVGNEQRYVPPPKLMLPSPSKKYPAGEFMQYWENNDGVQHSAKFFADWIKSPYFLQWDIWPSPYTKIGMTLALNQICTEVPRVDDELFVYRGIRIANNEILSVNVLHQDDKDETFYRYENTQQLKQTYDDLIKENPAISKYIPKPPDINAPGTFTSGNRVFIKGTIWEVDGFSSTSVDPLKAVGFYVTGKSVNPFIDVQPGNIACCFFQIILPPQYPAIYIAGKSRYSSEEEILLPCKIDGGVPYFIVSKIEKVTFNRNIEHMAVAYCGDKDSQEPTNDKWECNIECGVESVSKPVFDVAQCIKDRIKHLEDAAPEGYKGQKPFSITMVTLRPIHIAYVNKLLHP